MDKKRRAVIAGFIIFLLVMGVCSLVTKGIYTAKLPQVSITVPREMSLYHPVSASGAVETGQEYGVYTPAGLRVASLAVQKGDSFREGEPLFQLDIEDLEHILAGKKLELQRQAYQQREAESQGTESRQEGTRTLARAQEDYESARKSGELEMSRAREDFIRAQSVLDGLGRELDRARKELDQARKELEGQETAQGMSVSGGDGGAQDLSALRQQIGELESQVRQCQTQVTSQEHVVIAAAKAAEDAQLAHEDRLQAAWRSVEDAWASASGSYRAAADLAKLEQAYLQEEIRELEELLEAEGWIYARESGKITRLCVDVGQRTPDTAGLLYTPDDGLRTLAARLTREQAKYVSVGTRMQMGFETVSGGKQSREGIVGYMEPQEDGGVLLWLDVTGEGMELGQQVTLQSTWQSDNYSMVIPLSALHQDGNGNFYVYTLRQQNGILGVEWHASVLYVEVLDRNSRYAAIESVSLSEETQIILTSTGELKDNAVVRIVE